MSDLVRAAEAFKAKCEARARAVDSETIPEGLRMHQQSLQEMIADIERDGFKPAHLAQLRQTSHVLKLMYKDITGE